MEETTIGNPIDVPFTTEDVRDATEEVRGRRDELPIISFQEYEEATGDPIGRHLSALALHGYIGLGKPDAWERDQFIFVDLASLFSKRERQDFVSRAESHAEKVPSDVGEEIRDSLRGDPVGRMIGVGFRPNPEHIDEKELKSAAEDGWALGTVIYREPKNRLTRDEVVGSTPRSTAGEFYRRGGRYTLLSSPEQRSLQMAVGCMLLADVAFDRGSAYT
jgi:hypothetical protein